MSVAPPKSTVAEVLTRLQSPGWHLQARLDSLENTSNSTRRLHEAIHWSVTCQPKSQLTPAVRVALNAQPSLIKRLHGYEKTFYKDWDYVGAPRPSPLQTLSKKVQANGGSAPAVTLNTLTPDDAEKHPPACIKIA